MDSDRWLSMADCYDQMAPYLTPQYDWLQGVAIELVLTQGEPRVVVDLGGGSGIFLEKLLQQCPSLHAVWVDASEDFQRVATHRLARFADRVTFVLSPMTDDWESRLPGQPDAICSMSAIHHLASNDKRALYARCFDVLQPGGWLVNIDETAAPDDDAYRRTLHYWVDHVDRVRPTVPAELTTYADAWCERFKDWKARNLEPGDQPKQPGDDIHETCADQLTWLRAIGFIHVDLLAKFQLWSVMAGQRPAS